MASLLPDTGERVGHAEFVGPGSHKAENKGRRHSLNFTDSCNLSQLHLDKQGQTGGQLEHKSIHFSPKETVKEPVCLSHISFRHLNDVVPWSCYLHLCER